MKNQPMRGIAMAVLCLALTASAGMAQQYPQARTYTATPPSYQSAATIVGTYNSNDFHPSPLALTITGMDAAGNLSGSMSGMRTLPNDVNLDPSWEALAAGVRPEGSARRLPRRPGAGAIPERCLLRSATEGQHDDRHLRRVGQLHEDDDLHQERRGGGALSSRSKKQDPSGAGRSGAAFFTLLAASSGLPWAQLLINLARRAFRPSRTAGDGQIPVPLVSG